MQKLYCLGHLPMEVRKMNVGRLSLRLANMSKQNPKLSGSLLRLGAIILKKIYVML